MIDWRLPLSGPIAVPIAQVDGEVGKILPT
jgi:hypothetical protein